VVGALCLLGAAATALVNVGEGSHAATRSVLQAPCGTLGKPKRVWAHVVWIVMENKAYDQIVGSDNAPYVNKLAGQCGLATDFHAETSPSLPNYIALTSGSTQGITDDEPPSKHPLSSASIFSQLGGGWNAFAESMPRNCVLSDVGDLYAVRHNPVTYYTNVRKACARQAKPLRPRLDLSARFVFISPNQCHDMHSCPSTGDDPAAQTRAGDTWLSTFVPQLLNTPQYRAGSTAVFITWDEDDGSTDEHVATLVLSPTTPAGTQVATRFTHYSLLRTTEEMLGIGRHLGQAATAASMRGAFHL
jgi:hypothetical protein